LSGGSRQDRSGQLALMDAIVFFFVAATVSTVLLYLSAPGPETMVEDHGQGSADPSAVLEALIHSSIGCDLTIPVDVPRHLSRHTDIGQCLLLEAEGLIAGESASSFDRLNDAVGMILKGICSPVLDPYLSVWSTTDSESEALILIPGSEPASDQKYGATAELRNTRDRTLTVQLLLCPPSLPELVDVLVGDLDLRLGECAPPPELDPSDGHHYEDQNERQVKVESVVLPDIDQDHGRSHEVQYIEQVCPPGVRDFDGGGVAETDHAFVLDLVPVLDPDILASRAVEELHGPRECFKDI
jgi:hypothetical protein